MFRDQTIRPNENEVRYGNAREMHPEWIHKLGSLRQPLHLRNATHPNLHNDPAEQDRVR